MGEDHPAEPKVVVSFSPSHVSLNLNPVQRAKLIKLAGVRYNPSTDTIKMSCDTFETPAQNKRYLGDQVDVLLAEARDLKTETFEDIPFDFRHYTPKPTYPFPASWIVTPERRAELLAGRTKRLAEGRPVLDGLLYTPEGESVRANETRKAASMEREKALLADPELNKGDRLTVEENVERRKMSEKTLLVVDARARRPSKRSLLSPLLDKRRNPPPSIKV